MIDYKRKRLAVERTFDIESAAMIVVDVTDSSTGKRRTDVHARTLTLYTYDHPASVQVDYVVVEGRIVRKSDGRLGTSRMVGYAAKNWDGNRDELPRWIEEIITAEGLAY